MQPTAMLFSSSKAGHYAHILTSGLLGDVVVNQLTPPDPAVIQQWGSMIIQFLVAAVTIWATIRKALQKPETVVKLPVEPPVTITPGGASSDISGTLVPLVLVGLLLGSCASHQALRPTPAPISAAALADPPPELRLDSVVVGRAGARWVASALPVGRVGKKSTVSIYYGSAVVTTASVGKKAQAAVGPDATLTSIEKPRAAVAAAPGAVVQDYTKQGQRGGAAASGVGATATATTRKGLSWWWLLVPVLGGLGYVAWRKRGVFLA